jgi:sigma-B regulation protein RsbU (phosphoserine phosphatase)
VAPAPRIQRETFLYALLAVLFAIVLTYRVRDTIDRFDEVVRANEIARAPFDVDFPEFTIGSLEQEATAAGLRDGDRFVAMGGQPAAGMNSFGTAFANTPAHTTLPIDVESPSSPGASRRTVTVTLQPLREGSSRPRDWTSFAIGGIALPYLCFGLGFWVAGVRIRDKLSWILLLLLLGMAEFIGVNWRTLYGRQDWFQVIAAAYQPLAASLWPMSMMLFGIYFPERLPFDRRHPWAKWIVIAPIAFRAGVITVFSVVALNTVQTAAAVERIARPMTPVVTVLQFVAIATFFAALGFRIFSEKRPDARRRLRLLYWGASIALTPLCILAILLVTETIDFQRWMLLPLYLVLFIFPATMAYVIVVHRAMDVRLVVRQGVQYLLARGTIRGIQLALSAAIIVGLGMRMGPFADPSPGRQILMAGVAIFVILQIQRVAERLKRAVDRRFFRDAYDAEQLLSELAAKVRTMIDTTALLETVARQIASSLHVPRIAILLNGGGTLEPAYALGHGDVPRLPIPAQGFRDEFQHEIREALDAELVLPLSSNRSLVGVMSLGPKQSEEPYTRSDIRLLDAVAAQTGLALENSRLTAEIAAEVANREKAKRELEIAREVQERLFPQEYPPVAGVVFAGACRPALGVGGDYYDFIARSGTQLGIAVGDVSGKGVPAALLMATLRAYLRGQTVGASANLAELMVNLNRLVYESSAPNRYATFFYGEYDASSGRLAYVNAGHNPPIIFRRSGEIVRLDVGGPVIGLLTECAYEQGCVALQPGDTLVAFTDGVSEAMDADYQEWGEERLIESVRTQTTSDPKERIVQLMAAADGFVAGAPQHDDMTLVVLQCLPEA